METLVHSGVKEKSGRYRWGSGDRPFQRLERSGITVKKKETKENKKAPKQNSSLQPPTKSEKKDIISRANPEEIRSISRYLTTSELEDAYNRIAWTQKIDKSLTANTKTTMDKVKKVSDDMKIVSDFGRNGIDLWNQIAMIYNTTEAGKKEPWPLIGGNNKKKEK